MLFADQYLANICSCFSVSDYFFPTLHRNNLPCRTALIKGCHYPDQLHAYIFIVFFFLSKHCIKGMLTSCPYPDQYPRILPIFCPVSPIYDITTCLLGMLTPYHHRLSRFLLLLRDGVTSSCVLVLVILTCATYSSMILDAVCSCANK